MLTASGGGYSVVDGMDVTRWREDATRDCWGQYCYIRDLDDGSVWSAGRRPAGRSADEYQAELRPDRGVLRRRDGEIDTLYEVAVVPDADAEVRRVTLTNHGKRTRTLEITSYAEVALNPRRADQAHPAFAKLFLETERLSSASALLCRRRPRSRDQQPVWALHALAVPQDGSIVLGDVQFETDRARFLGRGRTTANPAALETNSPLSDTIGPVLDPVFCLRRVVRLAPGASVALALTTGRPQDRDQALALASRFADLEAVDRVFSDAAVLVQARLAELNVSLHDAAFFQQLASHILFTSPVLRAQASGASNRLGQPGLWPYGISGDLPIVLQRIGADTGFELAQNLVKAHQYWRCCGLVTDLVLLNDGNAELGHRLEALVRNGPAVGLAGKPGGIFLREAAAIPAEGKTLLEAAARIVLRDNHGNLAERLSRSVSRRVEKSSPASRRVDAGTPVSKERLLFANGLGGFTPDGREYVISLLPKERPPAPWANILANPDFGCVVTESGGGYTWAGNSQMNRLTPWTNDPVSDMPGEVIYLRDEETGDFWTCTPAPCGAPTTTVVRHGQGYSRFTCSGHQLQQDLLVTVSPNAPVKLFHLQIKNVGDRPRRLSATFYAEWVLGIHREQAAMQVVCTTDPESGALFATSAWAGEFAGRVAFADVSRRPRSFATDRAEFLGPEGSTTSPAAMTREHLSDCARELVDPCAAIMTHLEIAAGETEEIVFVLGQAAGADDARNFAAAYANSVRARVTLEEVQAHWDSILGTVQVRTPDAALDLMLNRWLLYQALACRMWARSGFYQSGGAYGFRDQLQDAMAVVYGSPGEARAQILRAAARQFEEGDVQHWWHPPGGRGVRTRITDDLYFLPLVACHYVNATSDEALLEECVPFLHAPVLRPGQEEHFDLPEVSGQIATLYEHCVRALEHGLKLGPHNIPLMGTGDWNDGMNQVGAHGQGESVWNGWFMLTTLQAFAGLAAKRNDPSRAEWCRGAAESLRAALEAHAWDGQWYRRAYFDDGTPLGSAVNDECQIDSIAQSWAVISGAADPSRARQAMTAVQQRLVRESDQLILLFDPPFDKGTLEPGYIKGYVPGIRENGGQYTHAATWVVLATALLGQGARAVELFGLLNPILHSDSPEKVARYKVEPYVVAADVYGAPPHTGRGGWTWYTGSAGWLYRVGLEAILGFRIRENCMHITPCIPPTWQGYEITYRYGSATYHVSVENRGRDVQELSIDGKPIFNNAIDLVDDGRLHEVLLILSMERQRKWEDAAD
jgi:cellobiose phosphorylase